jgi:hypothetical protein
MNYTIAKTNSEPRTFNFRASILFFKRKLQIFKRKLQIMPE